MIKDIVEIISYKEGDSGVNRLIFKDLSNIFCVVEC